MDSIICVDASDATDRQLLLAILNTVTRLEATVSELSNAVSDLQSAVSDLTVRVQDQIGPLQDALAAAQQRLDDFTLADQIEDEDYQNQINELKTELQNALDDASNAVRQIETSVGELNRVAEKDEAGPPADNETQPADGTEPAPEPEPAPEEPTDEGTTPTA